MLDWNFRSDLGTLTGGEQIAAPPALQGEALYCGLYLNELLLRLLHRGDPHADVFEAYREALAKLAAGEAVQPMLRVFEKDLLEAVGYGLSLEHEFQSQQPLVGDALYRYVPGQGPIRLGPAGIDRSTAISGSALLALQAGRIETEHLPELRRLMRRVIGYHVGDKPLASQALFLGLSKQRKRRNKPENSGSE